MSIREIAAAIALALAAAGCGRPGGGPPATTSPDGASADAKAPPMNQANNPPLPPAIDEASEPKGPCGGFESAPLDPPSALLGGRLRAQLVHGLTPRGAEYSVVPVDTLFGAAEVWALREGTRGLVVVIEEEMARVEAQDPAAQLAELFAAAARLAPKGSAARPLKAALPAVEIAPAAPEPAGAGLSSLTAYVVNADRTILRVRFFTSPDAQGSGCAALGRRMARTLSAGSALSLSRGGTQDLSFFQVDVPAGYVARQDRLPKGYVHRFDKLGQLGGPRAHVLLYFGQAGINVPFPPAAPGAAVERRPLGGREADWHTWTAARDGETTRYRKVALSGVGASQSRIIAGSATTDEALVPELDRILASIHLRP